MRVTLINSGFGVAVSTLIALVVLDARSHVVADTIVLKSGEKVEGRVTDESEMGVTISAETPTGKTERMIPRAEISSLTRNEPLAPAKTPEPESSNPADLSSVSPDKKWEYQSDESAPKIVKAGTNEVALDLSDQPAGNGFRFATVIWAPDSQRFAFNYGQGRTHATSLYQLRDGKWVALNSPSEDNEIVKRADNIVADQLKAHGLSEKKLSKQGKYLRLIWWTVNLDRWIDSNTAIAYASLQQVAARRDAPGEMDDGYGTDLLFTLRFDSAGKWKIVKTHQMSEKEVKEHQ
jgi:hypothetical protein